MSRANDRWRRRRGPTESGQAAGIETVPFGILVFIGGLIMVVNVWAVVDARGALDAAARDYLRAYTSAPDSSTARDRGARAVDATLRSRLGMRTRVDIVAPPQGFGPCRPATVRLAIEIEALRAPFIGSIGTTEVSTSQTELVQPFGPAIDEVETSAATVCDG